MPVTINCSDLGADHDFPLQGSTMDELVSNAAAHAVDRHGVTEAHVRSPEWREQMMAVIRNVSRPAHLRASSPPVPPESFGSDHSH